MTSSVYIISYYAISTPQIFRINLESNQEIQIINDKTLIYESIVLKQSKTSTSTLIIDSKISEFANKLNLFMENEKPYLDAYLTLLILASKLDRMRNFAPTRVEADLPMLDAERAKLSGGNEKFFAFIQKELFPFIESKYNTPSYRMFIGHSLGGLNVINALVNYTNLFNSYIAIDPSMRCDKNSFFEDCKPKLTQMKFKNIDLYLGIANTMDAGISITTKTKNTLESSKNIRSISALDKQFKINSQNQLHYKSKYYGNDSHNSVPLIAEYDSARFYFDFYKFDMSMKDLLSTDIAFPIKIEKHYETVFNKMGYKVTPNEGLINFFGYESLKQKKLELAEYLFKINVKKILKVLMFTTL